MMLCLRIHRGMPLHGDDETWVRAKAGQAAQFFATDLAAHFKAEEQALFPAMRDFAGAAELINDLISEHRKLGTLAEQFCETGGAQLVDALGEFADLLEAHIRKEERELFPLYEKEAGADLAEEVGRAVRNVVGDATQPRDRELLR